MDNLNQIISSLQSENKRLEKELKRVRGAITVLRRLNSDIGGSGKITTRRLSAAARKRIAQAQKERWAKWKAKKAA